MSKDDSITGSQRPHPSEALRFDTVHHQFSSPPTPRLPHPSEKLGFATVPVQILGHSGTQPHPSEPLEFATVHQSLRHGRGAPFGTPRLVPQQEKSWTFSEALASSGDEDRRRSSSIAFSPATTTTHKEDVWHHEYASGSDKNRSSSTSKEGHHHVNSILSRLSSTVPGLSFAESKAATHKEHSMTLKEGLRTYPKAMAWSLILSCTLIMEGFDLSLINGFYAFPSFKKRYGREIAPGDYELSTAWQQSLINGAVVGEIFGLVFNGIMTERIGYRRCLIYALLLLCGGIFLAFFAVHISMLMASEVICGLSWGVFQTLSTTYAAEVMPMSLRGYLTANVNLMWLIGQVTGLSVLRATVNWKSDWSFRLPFALQWAYAVPILFGVCICPESPWWLVRRERIDDAKKSLARLTTNGNNFNADEVISLMRHTNEIEKELTAGTSYWSLFKGVDAYRTEIVCMAWIIQVTCGGPMSGYSAYFFTRAGLTPTRAYDLAAGMYGLAIFAHIISLFLMRYVGRRTLYLVGLGLMSATLFLMGGLSTMKDADTSDKLKWTIAALNVLVTFWYDLTIGPICYSLVSEIPSTRLRVKTVALGRISYNLASIIANVLMPCALSEESWNLKGRTSFIWAVTSLLSLVWCYFRLVEPKGLTYIELDILFQKKASARKFRQFRVCLEDSGYFELVDEKKKKEEEELHWEGAG